MKDEVQPGGKWVFDSSVAAAFDDMLARSIPQYEVMRKACFDIGCFYRRESTDIVDLGCSRGEAIRPYITHFGATNSYVGVEVSEPMRAACCEAFKGWIANRMLRVLDLDLRKEYPHVNSSVTLSVLTLQFTPIEYRLRILNNIYRSLVDGGALILVEKVIGATADLDELMTGLYYLMKEGSGYDQDSIARKRLSLEGVLVPVTAGWNEEMLKLTGFKQVDCFWRWMNFAGWVAVK